MAVAVESAGLRPFPGCGLGLDVRVDPDWVHVAPTRRAAPPQLQGGNEAYGDVSLTADEAQGQGSKVQTWVTRLARPALGRRLRVQPQVVQNLLNHQPLEDGRNDLQNTGAAVRAVLHVDVKDALE